MATSNSKDPVNELQKLKKDMPTFQRGINHN